MTVKYIGSGYLIGIPARDLTDIEWGRLSDEQKKIALASGLYKLDDKKERQAKELPGKSGE